MIEHYFIRDEDEKRFEVINPGHWSLIESEDGEQDAVKWMGGANAEKYVSASRGFSYTKIKK